MSPGKYVERTRIDAARRLLEHTEHGVAAVARRCGFFAIETFHRSFKRLVGVTPPSTAIGSPARPPFGLGQPRDLSDGSVPLSRHVVARLPTR